jgi:hypothetical protein
VPAPAVGWIIVTRCRPLWRFIVCTVRKTRKIDSADSLNRSTAGSACGSLDVFSEHLIDLHDNIAKLATVVRASCESGHRIAPAVLGIRGASEKDFADRTRSPDDQAVMLALLR